MFGPSAGLTMSLTYPVGVINTVPIISDSGSFSVTKQNSAAS